MFGRNCRRQSSALRGAAKLEIRFAGWKRHHDAPLGFNQGADDLPALDADQHGGHGKNHAAYRKRAFQTPPASRAPWRDCWCGATALCQTIHSDLKRLPTGQVAAHAGAPLFNDKL